MSYPHRCERQYVLGHNLTLVLLKRNCSRIKDQIGKGSMQEITPDVFLPIIMQKQRGDPKIEIPVVSDEEDAGTLWQKIVRKRK